MSEHSMIIQKQSCKLALKDQSLEKVCVKYTGDILKQSNLLDKCFFSVFCLFKVSVALITLSISIVV